MKESSNQSDCHNQPENEDLVLVEEDGEGGSEPVVADHVHFDDEVSDEVTEVTEHLHAPDSDHESDDEEDSGNESDPLPVHEYFTHEPPDGGYGWVICACAFLHQLIADGLLFSFGVIYLSLLEHFKSGKSETSWVGAVLMGTSMITGPLAGVVASKYSLRTAGIVGSLIAAVGLFASCFAPSILILAFTYGIVTGVGVGFMFLTSILACSVYFRQRRALANGIAMCGSGVGVFVLSPMLVYLIDLYGWEGAMLCLSGFALNGCVVAALYRPLPPTRHTETFIEPGTNSDSGIDPAPFDDTESHADKSSIVNKHLQVVVQDNCDALSSAESLGDHVKGSMNLQAKSMSKLGISSHSLHRSGYWDHVQSKELSHLDLCQIGSMLTLPTLHSLKEHGLTHSRSAMTLEEKQSYLFWRYNNYECSSALSALCLTLRCYLLKNPTMVLLVISGMLWTGQSTTYMFIVDYARNSGISNGKSSWLLSVIGITNCIGRIIVGLVTDSPHVNSTLVYMVSIALAGVVNIVIPFVDNYLMLMLLAALFGLCMASYVSIRSIVVVDTMGIDNLAGALGLVVMFQGFAFTIVPPISGAILEATLTFKGPFVASGTCYLLAACLLIPIFFRTFRRYRKDHRINA